MITNTPMNGARSVLAHVAIVLVCAILLSPAALLVRPSMAHAQVGATASYEVNPAVVSGVVATGISTGIQTTILNALNGIAWTVAKLTIQSLTRSTVNWINSGFRGSPAFISDLDQNLKYLGDAVAEDFFLNLNRTVVNATGFNIVSPFQDQLSQKLREEYYRASSGLLGLNQYDLSGRSTDPKAFLNGDFSKGGFNAYFSANGNPANNPFDAYRLANRQLYAQIDAAAQKRKQELGWGKGFLPWRGNCTPTATAASSAPGSGDVGVSSADTRAVIDAAARNEAVGSNSTGADLSPEELRKIDNTLDTTEFQKIRTQQVEERLAGQNVVLSQAEQCRNNPVRTPGAVIESQLENSLGSGIRQLELADSINEIVGALLGQLVNQVLGAAGLSGVSQPSSGGGRSYLDQATSADQFNGVATSISNGVIQEIRNNQTGYERMRGDWQRVLDAAKVAEQRCGTGEEISRAVSRASEGVGKANVAIQGIRVIEVQVQQAIESTAVDKSTLISTAVTSYQSFLAAPTTPSSADISTAAIESSNTTDEKGNVSARPSLYSRMVELQRSCNPRGN